MFALANKKQTIVAEALTRADTLFAGGDSISEFASIVGEYADFCEIRSQKKHLIAYSLMTENSSMSEYESDNCTFTYLGTNVEILETIEGQRVGVTMMLSWHRWNASGTIRTRTHYTPDFSFDAESFSDVAERIMHAIEWDRRCEFCGVLLDIFQSYQPIHMCNECAMKENDPCKYCKISTGMCHRSDAHRECKRRRLN
jgi:hypothetical protein